MLPHEDGASITARTELDADFVVVGSGPAGATVARALTRGGASVVVLEEGPYVAPERYPESGLAAMALLYRDLGASLLLGRAPIPFVQGRAVGGTSVVNGAISWRLPRDVWDEWVRDDPALTDALPWAELEAHHEETERELGITPTDPAIAGRKNVLMALGASKLGLDHRPIARNVTGCRGSGRCLQGCPTGQKASMDRTYLADAVTSGARIFSSTRVEKIFVENSSARAVRAHTLGGAELVARARYGVVLAASAVQTPALLLQSGLGHGPVGRNFQCHPGVSMSAHFPEAVEMWRGATQGHEVTGLRREGIKLEVLGYDVAIAALRTKSVGRRFVDDVAELAHFAHFGAAIRARARGRVRAGRVRARVSWELAREDLAKLRRGLRVLGELMLAAGADYVEPGVFGWHERVRDPRVMARFEDEAPWDPRAYTAAVTHMFGTCAMSSRADAGVVRPDFRHHTVDRLWITDSSVFPTNTGVNPQTSIITLAKVAAARILDRSAAR